METCATSNGILFGSHGKRQIDMHSTANGILIGSYGKGQIETRSTPNGILFGSNGKRQVLVNMEIERDMSHVQLPMAYYLDHMVRDK